MSEFKVDLDEEIAQNIAVKYLTHLLDDNQFPSDREVQFMLACQEVLHFIMLPQEWEKRFDKDFVEYAEMVQ